MDLALNNLQRLICHKTQTNKQTIYVIYGNTYFSMRFALNNKIFLHFQVQTSRNVANEFLVILSFIEMLKFHYHNISF